MCVNMHYALALAFWDGKSDHANMDAAFFSIGDAFYHHFLQHVCFCALFCRVCIGGLGFGLPGIFLHYLVVLSRLSIAAIRKTQR